uniref:Acyl-CoA thioesterase 7 n=1 Tax=Rousettus aegyptiacus TaxID=9407 RepID=A0A7J8K489_ROUAE|nr:acyl-CoA thioesterase 7 [Rousettus aegyptiacus]
MRPDDANVAGNVHGGTILKMIEEAGAIISTRHCNSQNRERCVAALARVERTDFLSPLCIGEVVHASAEITYTSKHSEQQVHGDRGSGGRQPRADQHAEALPGRQCLLHLRVSEPGGQVAARASARARDRGRKEALRGRQRAVPADEGQAAGQSGASALGALPLQGRRGRRPEVTPGQKPSSR